MRVTSKHLYALERQVRESINIEKSARNSEECLNLKNEWAGSKIPGIKVTRPKGVSTHRYEAEGEVGEGVGIFQAALRRGTKRMEYLQDVPEDSPDLKEDSLDLKEVKDEEEHEEREEGRGNKGYPLHCKRQRAETAEEGWEAVSPIKWKRSPLSKDSKTFTSLNPKGKVRQ